MYGSFVGKSPVYPQKSHTNPLYGPGGVYTPDIGLFCRNIGPYMYRTLYFRIRALHGRKKAQHIRWNFSPALTSGVYQVQDHLCAKDQNTPDICTTDSWFVNV